MGQDGLSILWSLSHLDSKHEHSVGWPGGAQLLQPTAQTYLSGHVASGRRVQQMSTMRVQKYQRMIFVGNQENSHEAFH